MAEPEPMTSASEAVAVIPMPGVWNAIDFRESRTARRLRQLVTASGNADRLLALMEDRIAAWEELRAVTVWIGGDPSTLVALSWPTQVPPAVAAALESGTPNAAVALVPHPAGYLTARPVETSDVPGALAVDYWLKRPGGDRVLQLEFAVLESPDEPDLLDYLDELATGATWRKLN